MKGAGKDGGATSTSHLFASQTSPDLKLKLIKDLEGNANDALGGNFLFEESRLRHRVSRYLSFPRSSSPVQRGVSFPK